MNKIFAALTLATLLTSCGAKETGMTDNEKQARIDSLVGIRLEEINRQAMEDRDRRMAIEVKAKADSIIQANAPADNTQPGNTNQP